jgi:hypothetical protein
MTDPHWQQWQALRTELQRLDAALGESEDRHYALAERHGDWRRALGELARDVRRAQAVLAARERKEHN